MIDQSVEAAYVGGVADLFADLFVASIAADT